MGESMLAVLQYQGGLANCGLAAEDGRIVGSVVAAGCYQIVVWRLWIGESTLAVSQRQGGLANSGLATEDGRIVAGSSVTA